MNAMLRQQNSRASWLIWGTYATALLLAPVLFPEPASLSVLSQTGTAMLLALSYNMLLGQGGMMSFGHAVYSGLGGYVAIHALNLAAQDILPLPVSLVPLAGGLGGMFFGAVFGYISTRKAGTGFAMITLGMVELVFASALMFPDFFGGEGGVSGNRVIGEPFLGITFGPQIEVYYLIAAWLFISTAAMYFFTRTPLGRILNAVRDNAERVEFVGYDPRRVRYLSVVLSAFFAGVAGGLAALNFEIVSAENVSVARSAGILLTTFIGGIGYFFGPLLGAIAGVFMTVVLSSYTKAWQLYLGSLFILIVMFAPGGLAGICMSLLKMAQDLCRAGVSGIWKLLPRLAGLVLSACLACVGLVILVEMAYRRGLESADRSIIALPGISFDTGMPTHWLLAAVLAVAGIAGFAWLRRGFPDFYEATDSGLPSLGPGGESVRAAGDSPAHVRAPRGQA
ncbi:amino acid/amide ABC transporter membrane protein 2 (HAAT family) [Paucimonas lemoignei]|uniref:Amino acid/amide ABC transporter membrane protein 2 (HAAT family) n=1 Tax=Paucimonas lemoignei TaxID=29443 RepID=A0A4R3I372_PAULE|nr:branched-chain amino acid ABC transporter permease [Paucimonas lemoignei]TCS39251.1 amino acid/amide ABC transporter membrane protein 2 (HAAT family) [Paucimonas lemoignei]